MIRIALAAVLALGLGACSSTLISEDLAVGKNNTVNGIPYRVRDSFIVEVFQKTDDGYKSAAVQRLTLPDPTRVYVMNLEGQALSNANMKLELNSDGTLSTIHLSDESHAGAAATNLANGVSSVAAEQQKIRTARETRAGEPEAALEDLTTLTYQACVAQAKYDEAVAAASAGSATLAAKLDMVTAKQKANAAATKYGSTAPFPAASLAQDQSCP